MSGNLGRRLYTTFWGTTESLLGHGLRASRVSSLPNTPNTEIPTPGFLNIRTVKGFNSFSQATTRVTRRSASGGFLVLSAFSIHNARTAYAIPLKNIIPHNISTLDRNSVGKVSWLMLKRDFHTGQDDRGKTELRKDTQDLHNGRLAPDHLTKDPGTAVHNKGQGSDQQLHEVYPKSQSNRHLMDRLPHMPQLHRPTKEELLAAATGFWSRLKVRFKWFSIRSARPFNLDEITALFSWVLLGHVVWVVLGTTTFFSLLIIAINTVFAQGMFDLNFYWR